MFSITVTTEFVSRWALFIHSAMRLIHSSFVVLPTVEPGLENMKNQCAVNFTNPMERTGNYNIWGLMIHTSSDRRGSNHKTFAVFHWWEWETRHKNISKRTNQGSRGLWDSFRVVGQHLANSYARSSFAWISLLSTLKVQEMSTFSETSRREQMH